MLRKILVRQERRIKIAMRRWAQLITVMLIASLGKRVRVRSSSTRISLRILKSSWKRRR
jgi:hypothetical protein